MPKSKPPRKRHNPYRFLGWQSYKPATIKSTRAMLQTAQIAVFMKLGTGAATLEELRTVRDVFNAYVFSMIRRSRAKTEAGAIAECVDVMEAGKCVADVINRGAKIEHFVCTGEQMTKIYAAMGVVGKYIDKCLGTADKPGEGPTTFINELNGALLIRDSVQLTRRFSVDRRIINAAYEEWCKFGHLNGKVFEQGYQTALDRLSSMVTALEKRNANAGREK